MNIASHSAKAQPKSAALFVSDLHLQKSRPNTTAAFLDFLRNYASHTKSLYLLGDIFEYWAGDDDLSCEFNQQIAQSVLALQKAGVKIFWIDGNRDFLAGAQLMQHLGALRLPDPYISEIAGRRILLSHGDAYCTDDLAYMAFRKQVRNKAWQDQFLALPLAQRKEIIAGVRKNSRKEQEGKTEMIMDVNHGAICELIEQSNTRVMIHGHTHRPAHHLESTGVGQEFSRYVLPDWEMDSLPVRGGWIAITDDGNIERHFFEAAEPEASQQ